MMNQKGSVGVMISIILIFVIGIGVAYYLGTQNNQNINQQTPVVSVVSSSTPHPITGADSSPETKTYTNKTLEYQVYVPLEWKISEESFIGGLGDVLIIPPEEINTEVYRTEIAITSPTEEVRYSLNTEPEFQEWITKSISDGKDQRLYKLADRLIDGLKAVEFISRALPGDGSEAFYSKVVWFRKDNKNYYIEFGGQEKIVNNHTDTWNSILGSFKFIN